LKFLKNNLIINNKNVYNYFITLFVRSFVIFSGFVVFLVTSYIFGPEGRGVIGLGTSVASFFGLVFSFNLGRSFLNLTQKSPTSRKLFLFDFLTLNYLLMFIAILMLFLYYFLNIQIKLIFDFDLLLPFFALIPFYLWSVNGSDIFAALNKTKLQDIAILITRLILIFMALFVYIFNFLELRTFLYLYAFILGFGTIIEMRLLGKPSIYISFKKTYQYFSNSIIPHIDYLSFVLFPLILMVMSAHYLNLTELGNLNFTYQLIYFIFTFSFVASLKIKTYVSQKGMLAYSISIKKLLFYTIIFSFILVFIIYIIVSTSFFNKHFPGFENISDYFLILSLSIPGYMFYHFLYPILIEYRLIHYSMKFNLIVLFLSCFISFWLLNNYGILGACFSFSLFFCLIFISYLYLYKKLKLLFV